MAELEELIQTATDASGSSFGRRMAVSDLGRSDDDRAFQALATLLKDEDQYLRREVVSALARKRDYRAVEPLIEALIDDDDYIQRDAAAALGKLGDIRAIEPLQMLSEDDSYSVRDAAKRALEAIEREPRTPPQPPPSPPPAEIGLELPDVEDAAVEPEDEEQEEAPAPVETTPDEIQEEPFPDEPVSDEVDSEMEEESGEDVAVDDIPSVSMAEVLESPASFEMEPVSAPWEQVTEIVAAGPSEIVTAEIVVEPTTQPTAEIEPLPVDAFLHGVPDGFSWESARRMQAFFEDQLPDVQRAYEQLHEQQKKLLIRERDHHEIVQQLGFRRADKDDDIAQCEDEIDAAKEKLLRLEQSAARARRELNRVKAEANSIGHHVSSMIWPDKAKKNQQLRSDIEAALRKLEQQTAATRDRISELNEQHAELTEPRKRLQAAAEGSTADTDAAGELVREASEEINERITRIVRHLPQDELDARLKQLGVMSADGAYFHACVTELMTALSELDGTLSQSKKADVESDEAVDLARQATDALGSAIASGFHVVDVEMQTPVRLNGSLHFKEDHSFFGGYSGASGSATGSGTGQASYSVDQMEWQSPGDFRQQVADFAESWALCGEQTARREMLSAMAVAGRRIVAEYIHFIRTELERDFIELHAER